MLLLCHGGKCCGIKHIHGFSMHPTLGELSEKYFEREEGVTAFIGGAGWQSESAGKNFFEGHAPAETAEARLDRYLTFCKEEQCRGLIEVTLIKSQKDMWEKKLLERGFVLVTEFTNSNTSHKIYVYHKINK